MNTSGEVSISIIRKDGTPPPTETVIIPVIPASESLIMIDPSHIEIAPDDEWIDAETGVEDEIRVIKTVSVTAVDDGERGAYREVATSISLGITESDDNKYNEKILDATIPISIVYLCDPDAECWAVGSGYSVVASGTTIYVEYAADPPSGYAMYEAIYSSTTESSWVTGGGTPLVEVMEADPGGTREFTSTASIQVQTPGGSWKGTSENRSWSCGVIDAELPTQQAPIGVYSNNPANTGLAWRLTTLAYGMLDGCGQCSL